MKEDLLMGALIIGVPLSLIIFITWLLHYFVALRAEPSRRAAWTVAPAYVATAAACTFGGPEGYKWAGPLAALPGALLVYWWWRTEFREGWIDDSKPHPEGVVIANSNWRIGLMVVVAMVAAAAVRAGARWAFVSH